MVKLGIYFGGRVNRNYRWIGLMKEIKELRMILGLGFGNWVKGINCWDRENLWLRENLGEIDL